MSVPVSPEQAHGADCAAEAYCFSFLLVLVAQDDGLDPRFARVLETPEVLYGRTTAPRCPPPKCI